MSSRTIFLNEHLYRYLLDNSLREPEILAKLRHETAKLPEARIQITPEQGQFMALLIELMQAKKTLELGVFTGYSTLAVALALPRDGKIIACEINKEWLDIAQQFWEKAGIANKIEIHLGPALTTLDQLIFAGQANTFDFVFIDANKKNYVDYYEKSLQLLRPGGLIVIDNVFQAGRVTDENAQDAITVIIRNLNEKVHKDDRITLSMIPIGDGLTLVRKK